MKPAEKTEKEKCRRRKKLKILFLAVNSSYSHTMLSYGYIRRALENRGYSDDWIFKEYTLKDNPDNICTDILETEPDVILSTVYLFNREFITDILTTAVMIMPELTIFLGGPEFLGSNERFLRENSFADAVIRGDESSLYQLLENYKNPHLWNGIKGVCTIINNIYYDYGTAVFDELSDISASPYYPELITGGKPFMQLETTRGCRGRCAFCTSAVSEYREVMPPGEIRSNLKKLRQAGYKEIRIVDRTFNDNNPRAAEILNMFLNEFPDMRFHLELNPAFLSAPLLEIIKASPRGMLHIEVGIQTLDKNVSRRVSRFGNVEKSLQGLKILCELPNIEVHADLIAGLPEQTVESIFSDIYRIVKLMPAELQLELLKVLNGTPITGQLTAPEYSYLPKPPYTVIRTPSMTFKELLTAKRISKIIDGYYNTDCLKSIFRFLTLKYTSFLNDFTQFYSERNRANKKMQLSERFKILKEFIAGYDDCKACDLLKFSWLAAGLQISSYNIKSISGIPEYDSELIWKREKNITSKRYYTVSFNWNAGEIWADSNTEIRKGKNLYLFRLAYGNLPASISKITDNGTVSLLNKSC